jgi:outer membrane protein assembly factor BamB
MKKLIAVVGFLLGIASGAMLTHAEESGQDILSTTGVQGGLVVHLGTGSGKLTTELHGGESYLVRGLDTNLDNVRAAREYVESQNLYGSVSIDRFDGRSLPFIDNLVSLVVAQETSVPMSEIMRVLHPYGVAYIGGTMTVKSKPEAIDEWTHYLHGADNNAVAHDSLIGPPKHMQFLAAPLWSRHHDRLASLSSVVTAGGRLFYINDNGPVFDPDEAAQWTITARNAFNGVFLWRKSISSWTDIMRKFRSGPVQLQRLLVTDGDRVFVTLGLDEPISVLDAATGEEIAVLEGTDKSEEFVMTGGVLYVQIGEHGAEQALIERRGGEGIDYKTTKLIKAVDATSGKTLWRWPEDKTAEIMPRTLAVSDGGVFFQESGETVCLDASTGNQIWRTNLIPPAPEPEETKKAKQNKPNAKQRKKADSLGRSLGWTFATLVVQDGVVLSCDGNTLLALNGKSGELMWQCAAKTPFGKTPSVDILVTKGVVWTSPDLNEGRDLKTGEILKSNNLGEELVTAGHHHRCYRNKATDRYVIQGYRGLEFRDTQGDDHCRHNWIRGICQYGIMPANGMVYIPPHNCSCYPEAKLYGLWTLKASESSLDIDGLSYDTILEKGPAYGQVVSGRSSIVSRAESWPMHRHDPQRSGILPAPISADKVAWNVQLNGRLSAPVIAQGTLLVSLIDRHRVLAFDAASGEAKWSFTAGGPVDSPPTIYGDTALFGSADGYAYCLRLSDGNLVWRLRAAPADRKTVALQQVESLWPVHGSILVVDDTAYFTAGRSSHIDGGIFLYGLDPVSGDVKVRQRLNSPPATPIENTENIARDAFSQNTVDYKTQQSPDRSDAFSMAGNLSDILVADDDAIYLRHMKFDRQLQPAADWTHHLFSTSSLLDDSESYRAHWFYGNGDFSRLPVAYEWLTRGSYGGFSSPLGKFLVFDEKRLWGSGWKSLALFTTDITDIDGRLDKDFPKVPEKITHQSLAETLPIHPRGMLKAADVLYLAGYPAESTVGHFYGEPIRDRGILLQIDASSGAILAQTDLPASPMFDSISAADGRLYMSLENGSLICLK